MLLPTPIRNRFSPFAFISLRRGTLRGWALVLVVLCLVPGIPALQHQAQAQAQARIQSSTVPRHPVTVGYFPQWGIYNDPPYYVKDLVRNGGVRMLDQINYAQGFVTGGRCSVADPHADLELTFSARDSVSGRADSPDARFRGNLHQLQLLKRRYPHLKLLISLEGKAASFAQDARPENRTAFVTSCVDTFLRGHLAPGIDVPHLFDGIDVDWEYPDAEDAENFLALLTEFRRQMDALRPGLRLTIAVGPSPNMYSGTDFVAVSRLVDQVGLMSYDYTGPWNRTTGFLAPLFPSPGAQHQGNIDHSIAAYEAAGVPADRLLIGIPFYGYSWTAVEDTNDGLFQPGESDHEDRSYRYIQALGKDFTARRDPHSGAPWLFDGETFWTYDDPVSIELKGHYAVDHHLGGIMIWELSGDTADARLLRQAHQALTSAPGTQAARHVPAQDRATAALQAPEGQPPSQKTEPGDAASADHTSSTSTR